MKTDWIQYWYALKKRKKDDSTFEKLEATMNNLLNTDISKPNISASVIDRSSSHIETDLGLPSMKNKTYILESKATETFKVSQTTHAELQSKAAIHDDICKVCYEKPYDSVLFPCGHCQVCFICCLKLLKSSGLCPLCRTQVSEIDRISMGSGLYSLVEVLEVVDLGNISFYIELLNYIDSITNPPT